MAMAWQSVVKVCRPPRGGSALAPRRAMRPAGDESKSRNIGNIRAPERRRPDGMQRSSPEGRLRARMQAGFHQGLLGASFAFTCVGRMASS